MLSLMLTVCPLMMQASAETEAKMLKFNDGKFKILVLADVQDTDKPQTDTMDLMKTAIEKTQPDLIILTGDNVDGAYGGVTKEKLTASVELLAKTIDSYGIPFAYVYGNHDSEGLCREYGMTEDEAKKLIFDIYDKYENCIAVPGEEMTGFCNYNLLIKDSKGEKDIYNLWLMDSNTYDEENGGYGYVHEDQTEWYKKTSNALKEANGGTPVPSLLFQHIIVPEVFDMFKEVPKGTKGAVSKNGKYYVAGENVYEGNLNEAPCPPDSNHGQFDSWLAQGDIVGAFFGHDHTNDFAGEYKGIKMVAVPGVTYFSYGNHHGVRTITLDENDLTDFESEIFLFDDLLDRKETNSLIAKMGYQGYKNTFLPIFWGSVAGIAVLGAGVATAVVLIKKRKKK